MLIIISIKQLGAFLRRLKSKVGAPKAITATAYKIARLIYSMMKHGQDYVDVGQDYKGILKNLPHKWMEIFQHHYLFLWMVQLNQHCH